MKIIKGLEYLLELTHITQQELSEKLNTSKQNVNMWVRGKQSIPKKYLNELEQIFHVSKSYFSKDITEVDKLEIQREKLLNESEKHMEEFEVADEFKDWNHTHMVYNDPSVEGTLYKLDVQIKAKKLLEQINENFSKFSNTDEKENIKELEFLFGIYSSVNDIYESKKIQPQRFIDILLSICIGYGIDDSEIYFGYDKLCEKLVELFRIDRLGEGGKKKYQLYKILDETLDENSKDKEENQRKMSTLLSIHYQVFYLEILEKVNNIINEAYEGYNQEIIRIFATLAETIENNKININIVESILKSITDIFNESNISILNDYNSKLVDELKDVIKKYL